MNFKTIKLSFKIRHKRIHTVWLHLILNANLNDGDRKQIRVCLGLGAERDLLESGTRELLEEKILYLDCSGDYTGIYVCQIFSSCIF